LAYAADATELEPGSIVKVEKPLGSSGKPTYPHFFIVLSIPSPVDVGSRIPLVGVSSRIDPGGVDPAKHVLMKWLNRRGGDPETGFSSHCYACMDFTHILEVYEGPTFKLEVAAEHRGKFIRADRLQTVVAAMNAWARREQLRRAGGRQ
jgi:hypothetical protein